MAGPTGAFLSKLIQGQAVGPLIVLLDFYDLAGLPVRRLTNNNRKSGNPATADVVRRVDITPDGDPPPPKVYRDDTYKSFPFYLDFPDSGRGGPGQIITLAFANYPDQAGISTLKADLLRSIKVTLRYVSKERPDTEELFPEVSYFFSPEDTFTETTELISMTFSTRVLENIPFPYRRFNSAEHPTLYEDFWEEDS